MQILVEVGTFQMRVGHFANSRWKGTSPPTIVGVRTRVFLLPYNEDRMILSSFVRVQYIPRLPARYRQTRTVLSWLLRS